MAKLGTAFASLWLAACCPPVGAAEAAKCPYAPDLTYEQRAAASPRNKPLIADALALPQPHAATLFPAPARVKANSPIAACRDRDGVLWQLVPWQDAYQDYLATRRALLAQDQSEALIDWCEHNHFALCAEFELRRLLFAFRTPDEPGYRLVLRRWLRYADRRQTEYAFPLPLRGAWRVWKDETDHHRAKAGAAFAFDFVIAKGDRPHAGAGLSLTDHYAWDQPIVAQADGIVRAVTDAHPDPPPGQNGGYDKANTIVVDYGGGILAYYGHVRQGSAKLKQGDRVKLGQELARVGNSGASGVPHLHFSFLDTAHLSLRGRFRCEARGPQGWQRLDGEDLKEGLDVRNAGTE